METLSNTPLISKIFFGQTELKGFFANFPLLILRVFIGLLMFRAGWDKMPTPAWMVEQVIQVGFPAPEFFAWLACFSEVTFGLFLIFGLMSRFSAFALAFTMGVAAFGFHQVTPFLGMHITHIFFWILVVFVLMGGGAYSLDALLLKQAASGRGKLGLLVIPILAGFLGFSLYLDFTAPKKIPAEEMAIESINIPGSFNDWNPGANEMVPAGKSAYKLELEFPAPGPIEFKFTVNKAWDINFGETDQEKPGMPASGTAEKDKSSSAGNIRAFIPKPGNYLFEFDSESLNYRVTSLDPPEEPEEEEEGLLSEP